MCLAAFGAAVSEMDLLGWLIASWNLRELTAVSNARLPLLLPHDSGHG